MNEIFELSQEEIEGIGGGAQIAPPASLAMGSEYPQVDNDPPG